MKELGRKLTMQNVTNLLLMVLANTIFFSSILNANECTTEYESAPLQLVNFIDREVGVNNLFRRNFQELGLESNRCPAYGVEHRCVSKSILQYESQFRYPIVNGLYYYYIYSNDDYTYHADEMYIGRVLDDNYLLEDVIRAIKKQTGISPDRGAKLSTSYDDLHVYYVYGANLKISDKYIKLDIMIYGVHERPGELRYTVIDYQIEDKTSSVQNCIERHLDNKAISEKGKTLRLN